MDNTTLLLYNLSGPQKIDMCNTMCDMASTVITQSQSKDGINKNYFFYIGIGALLIISEAIGLTKKIPANSIVEAMYMSAKAATAKVFQNGKTPEKAAETSEA